MFFLFNSLRSINFFSVAARLILAFLCGGLIGLEREYKRRSAGFRTHVLICLGASMTTLTGQFLAFNMHYTTDITRLGAQVIAGVGFIGAGAIITTRQHQVKGLTTAAGLWVTAIIGLAFGSGFVEAGLTTTLLILMAELYLSKLEYRMRKRAPEVTLYIEYRNAGTIDRILQYLQDHAITVLNTEFSRVDAQPEYQTETADTSETLCAVLTIRIKQGMSTETVLKNLRLIPSVNTVEEL